MSSDLGLVICTFLVLGFGLSIAVFLPMLVNKHSRKVNLPFESAAVIKWMRVMGFILVVVTAIELIALWILKTG